MLLRPRGAARPEAPSPDTVFPSYVPGGEFTVGAEEELVLVQPDGSLLAAGGDVVARLAALGGCGRVSEELFAGQVELSTDVCRDANEVGLCLARFRRAVADAGALGIAVGVHPSAPFGAARTTHSARYDPIAEDLGGLFRAPTSAFQVHVGMPDAASAMSAYRGLRNRLALLRALAAASPFWHGWDSGLASARAALVRSYPRTTVPPVLRSYAEYECRTRAIVAAAEAPDYTYVWWDLRLQPRLGTLEVRVMDAQPSVRRAVALTALVQGLARHAVEHPTSVDLPTEVLDENDFRAFRYGIEARIVDVDGALKPLRQIAHAAQREALRSLCAYGSAEALDGIATMLAELPEPSRQRAVVAESGIPGLVRDLISRTMSGD